MRWQLSQRECAVTSQIHAVQFLGFDTFGTIVDWRTGVARAVNSFASEHGLSIDPFDFADRWRALYQPAMEEVRSGRRGWVALEVLHRENLETVLRTMGLDVAAFDDQQLAHVNRAWERLDPWPDSVEGLRRLKKRYTIAPISNGSIAGMTELARFGGLPWQFILGAEITRTYKPQPQTYLGSVKAAGQRPKTSAMVAAHNSDLSAARALGMATVFIRRPIEHGPDQTTDLEPEDDWDIIAQNLIEVAERLGC
ncbi:haloacid dehalogenase type II [Rhizobium cauense]|nr:haloacid dehalogenase type II [Rhizobium cauense]